MNKDQIIPYIKKVKETNDNESLENILMKMQPLIKKYSKKLYFMEKEDALQELSLALIEAIYSIKYYDNEAMCISYINKFIINRYIFLCKFNIKNSLYQHSELTETISYEEKFSEIEFFADIEKILTCKNDTQKLIVRYILIDGLSDAEISSTLNVSRQYVNRIKKKLFKQYQRDL